MAENPQANHRSMRPRRGVGLLAAAPVLTALLALAGPVLQAGATGFGASITDQTSTLAAGTLIQSSTTQGAACYSTGAGSGGTVISNAATCSTNPFGATPRLSNAATQRATFSVRQVGTATPSSASAALSSCGPQEVVTAAGHGDTGVVFGGAAPGALASTPAGTPQGRSMSFSSATTGFVTTATKRTAPGTLTEIAWFKAPTTGFGGVLIAFSPDQGATPNTTVDRAIWMDKTGHLVHGLLVTGFKYTEQVTGGTYDNGKWNMVAVTDGVSGEQMWVDGTRVNDAAGRKSIGNTVAGYFHIGGSPLTTWARAPTHDDWQGTLARVAVLPTEITQTEVTTLYDANGATYASDLAALDPTGNWPLDDAGDQVYSGALTGLGIGAASSRYADVTGNGDTATPQGAVTPTATGPLGSSAIAINGSATSNLTTPRSFASPGNTGSGLTEIAWFKASSTSPGGSIMGFTTKETTVTATTVHWDRQIWMKSTGTLVYGIYPNAIEEVSSGTNTYDNGKWNMVAASYGPGGEQLWVNGVEVGSGPSTVAQTYTGWWHIGYSRSTVGWPTPPSRQDWNGSLGQVAVIPKQLSGTQIASLDADTTTTSFEKGIKVTAPTAYWPLTSTTVLGTSPLCADIGVTVQSGSTCVYPAGAGACPTPTTTHSLAGLSNVAVQPSTRTAAVAVSVAERLGAAAPPPPAVADLAGLHVLSALTLSGDLGSWSESTAYPFAEVWY